VCVLLAPATVANHLGTFVIVLVFGFLIGVAGHIIHSRTLVITGIIVIAAVSIYFAAAGEVQSFPH
jgi:NaMN:DMB phosphoribosyltransferase